MTSPPRTAEPRAADAGSAPARRRERLGPAALLAIFFAAVTLLHLPVITLPYYWDEAGYFIPAARDIYAEGEFVTHSTLSNAHPPLVMAYLALAWRLFGFSIPVARAAMLLVAAATLLGVFRLSERVANRRVAWATVVCTALYPVFFAQSSLAHLDMAVAALTVWGLVFYLPRRDDGEEAAGVAQNGGAVAAAEGVPGARAREGESVARRAPAVALFALAALAKETAILVPVTLAGWELLCWAAARARRGVTPPFCLAGRGAPARSLLLLLALVPLALWFAYHYTRTGYVFGNPEYFRYNVESTVNAARILEALWGRLRHVTVHMNLFALTAAAAAAMFFPARRDPGGERRRIDVPVQIVFALLVLAHVVALSIVGGAVLARYMLPVYPLIILVCVSTLWRRVRRWALVVAAVCLAFALGIVVDPPHSFPWEENLAYRDFVLLHRDAAQFIEREYPRGRVLTTWPATDELKNPYYGYLERPREVVAVDNFMRGTLERAAAGAPPYEVAFLFSTHGGVELDEAASLLGGRVVFRRERRGQWVGVLEK